MRKILIIFVLFFSSLQAGILYTNDPTLNQAINKIEACPEAKACIDKITEPIFVTWCQNRDFDGFWNWKTRTITISAPLNPSQGQIITTLLFEVHNALAVKKLQHVEYLAAEGHISKTEYVRSIEKIEHNNAVATAKILRAGISASHFPKNAEWPVFEDFSDHYLLQRMSGHSDWIADKYDQFGKWRNQPYLDALTHLNEAEKQELLMLFNLKQQLKYPDKREQAKKQLKKELDKESICRTLPSGHPACQNREHKDEFLRELFPLIDIEIREINPCGIHTS